MPSPKAQLVDGPLHGQTVDVDASTVEKGRFQLPDDDSGEYVRDSLDSDSWVWVIVSR